jgi:hypothetical protein
MAPQMLPFAARQTLPFVKAGNCVPRLLRFVFGYGGVHKIFQLIRKVCAPIVERFFVSDFWLKS